MKQHSSGLWVSADGRVLDNLGELPQSPAGKGYLTVSHEGSKHYVHRLVLEAFVGPCPEGFETGHLDGSKTNNKLENLEWVSRSANNLQHKEKTGTLLHGETHPNRKLSEAQVKEIVARKRAGERADDLGLEFGIHRMHVNKLCRGEQWRREQAT